MEQKYIDKIRVVWDVLEDYYELSSEDSEERLDMAYYALDKLAKTKDQEVLEALLNFFREDYEDRGEICEHLKAQIGANFPLGQVLQALYKKFDFLAEQDVSRLVQFSLWFLNNGMFPEFRKMFNCVRSNYSPYFLDELNDWCFDGRYQEERRILREDLNNWRFSDSSSK